MILCFGCRFLSVFSDVYKELLSMVFTGADREWLIGIIMRELEVKHANHGVVNKDVYDGEHAASSYVYDGEHVALSYVYNGKHTSLSYVYDGERIALSYVYDGKHAILPYVCDGERIALSYVCDRKHAVLPYVCDDEHARFFTFTTVKICSICLFLVFICSFLVL